jgi:hypothetical protein
MDIMKPLEGIGYSCENFWEVTYDILSYVVAWIV